MHFAACALEADRPSLSCVRCTSVCAEALASGTNVVALVPWAPIQHGSQALDLYLSRLLAQPSLVAYTERLGSSPIKSFRYLIQDSPKGFFSTDEFIDGLAFLGNKGYAFDMTLDVTHQETGGPLILDDAIDTISKVRELQKDGGNETKFILGNGPPIFVLVLWIVLSLIHHRRCVQIISLNLT